MRIAKLFPWSSFKLYSLFSIRYWPFDTFWILSFLRLVWSSRHFYIARSISSSITSGTCSCSLSLDQSLTECSMRPLLPPVSPVSINMGAYLSGDCPPLDMIVSLSSSPFSSAPAGFTLKLLILCCRCCISIWSPMLEMESWGWSWLILLFSSFIRAVYSMTLFICWVMFPRSVDRP